MSNSRKPTREIGFDEDNLDWFDRNFPWHGSLSQFVNQCLRDFRQEWGDTPPPHEVAARVIRKSLQRGMI